MNLVNIARCNPLYNSFSFCRNFSKTATLGRHVLNSQVEVPKSRSLVEYPPSCSSQVAEIVSVIFPTFTGLNCNMMPFVMGDKKSLPSEYHPYWNLIKACELPLEELGEVGFLTCFETHVQAGSSQRRGGVHVEKHPGGGWGWGGGGRGIGSGLFMASTIDKTCRAWNCYVETPGPMGDCSHLRDQLKKPFTMRANRLYWMSDSCPHEALPQQESGRRQYFRLVTSHVDLWYKAHSTANPLVALPKRVRVIEGSKFS